LNHTFCDQKPILRLRILQLKCQHCERLERFSKYIKTMFSKLVAL
jgi:hypothetical protein